MIGFLFGTMCLFGFAGLMKASFIHHHHGAYAHGHGGGCHGGRWGGHGGGRGRRGGFAFDEEGPRGDGFARAFGEILKRRLRIDEDQEGLVDHALIDLRAAVKELATVLKDSRKSLADAFRGEKVDDAALAASFGQHDEAITRARRDVVSALKQVHAVLTPEQRAQAADWLAQGDAKGWV